MIGLSRMKDVVITISYHIVTTSAQAKDAGFCRGRGLVKE